MRPDLERVGVFTPVRVRERFRSGYRPENTMIVVVDGTDVGCIAVRPDGDERWVEHFYLPRRLQGAGIGTAVLDRVLALHGGRVLRLNVLRGSRAQRLYERAGFRYDSDEGVDVFLRRDPDRCAASEPSSADEG
ncbi:N-acetyltransferase [Mycetocola reblochoni]|nr:N-acetyltransferase [Mycetocola reblochoni]